jgi:IS5 family transposase
LSLSQLAGLIEGAAIARDLVGLSASRKGEPGWPPVALLTALRALASARARLLATWQGFSDVKLAEALDDRASFRRFCGFAAHEPTPERTAFVRFRRELVARGLDRVLFDAVTRQLEAKGVMVRTGTLVDATLIPSAGIRGDREVRWAGHRRQAPTHGDKAHVATGQAAVPIRGVEVTTATVHDAERMQAVLPSQPGDVYGDCAFAGRSAERVIIAQAGTPQVVHTGTWGRPEALARPKADNARVQRIRCRIETLFGTCKRSCGLRRMRWIGLAKAGLQVRLAAIACTLRRTVPLIRATA